MKMLGKRVQKLGQLIDMVRNGEHAPDRHKNPYIIQSKTLKNELYTQREILSKTPIRKSKFEDIFANFKNDIILEVGSYYGHMLLDLSQNNPNLNFLGLDITYKRVVKTALKIQRAQLANCRVAMIDAQSFLSCMEKKEILKGLCIFFPDPWPKDRHKKHRLLSNKFFETVFRVLKENGFIWIKTDCCSYYKEAISTALQNNFKQDQSSHETPQEFTGGPYTSIFEKLFVSQKKKYYSIILRKF